MMHLSEMETIILQKLGPVCVAAHNAYQMCMALPNVAFLLWRWFTLHTPEDVALNNSLFIFLPLISLSAGYFGGFLGRSIVYRRMKAAAGRASEGA